MKFRLALFLFIQIYIVHNLQAQIAYPGDSPGKATLAILNDNQVVLENNVIRMEFVNDGKNIYISGFEDKAAHDRLNTGNMQLFEIVLQNGDIITSDDFSLVKPPSVIETSGDLNSTIIADRLPGKKYIADFLNREISFSFHWEADLRDGSNYIRNIFSFNTQNPGYIKKIILINLSISTGARKAGYVDGSPLICNNMFFSLEHPLSKIDQNEKNIVSYLPWLIEEISTVWGVTPENQLRRGFLYYVERERIHPYHQVLHYNSWYDISWQNRKFDESQSLDRIRLFGDSLITKRHVKMKGFLFDDGWDDNKTLWKFHSGFPYGFGNMKKAAQKYNSDIGAWLSPFGGYGEDKAARIVYGNKQDPPFETNEQGFSLSGPVYYRRFKEVTADFIKKYDICMFKFDGVGRGSGAEVVYQKDVEAFLTLLKDLHRMKTDLYFSLTTGTWPSVYWLKYGDNIWRGGDDTNMSGEGSKRQQWITYRDAETYKNIVKAGPLYPLNSLMLCGICIADNGNPAIFEMNDKDIKDEIWSFFSTGTNLQELYINPHKLNTAAWNCLADASRWAADNESVMTDTHWVGGDPAKGDIYGFAAWSPGKAILSLRNPTSVEKTFEVKTADIFELPRNIIDIFIFYDAITGSNMGNRKAFAEGRLFKISLKPFEVIVLDAIPKK
jgi:hypothetical protein